MRAIHPKTGQWGYPRLNSVTSRNQNLCTSGHNDLGTRTETDQPDTFAQPEVLTRRQTTYDPPGQNPGDERKFDGTMGRIHGNYCALVFG